MIALSHLQAFRHVLTEKRAVMTLLNPLVNPAKKEPRYTGLFGK